MLLEDVPVLLSVVADGIEGSPVEGAASGCPRAPPSCPRSRGGGPNSGRKEALSLSLAHLDCIEQ